MYISCRLVWYGALCCVIWGQTGILFRDSTVTPVILKNISGCSKWVKKNRRVDSPKVFWYACSSSSKNAIKQYLYAESSQKGMFTHREDNNQCAIHLKTQGNVVHCFKIYIFLIYCVIHVQCVFVSIKLLRYNLILKNRMTYGGNHRYLFRDVELL